MSINSFGRLLRRKTGRLSKNFQPDMRTSIHACPSWKEHRCFFETFGTCRKARRICYPQARSPIRGRDSSRSLNGIKGTAEKPSPPPSSWQTPWNARQPSGYVQGTSHHMDGQALCREEKGGDSGIWKARSGCMRCFSRRTRWKTNGS